MTLFILIILVMTPFEIAETLYLSRPSVKREITSVMKLHDSLYKDPNRTI